MTLIAREPSAARMSPGTVRATAFTRRRRGYDEEEVREFLDRLADEITSADAERGSMRAELARLREENARLREQRPAPSEGGGDRMEISAHAVSLLSQAQQAADSCVAEAEHYARDLVAAAREQYQEILQKAQEAASRAVQELPPVQYDQNAGHPVPVQEIEYVRTFAQVAQVQLRSVLDALAREVDRLGALPGLQPGSPPPTPAEVSWLPSSFPDARVAR